MEMRCLSFDIVHRDGSSRARRGIVRTLRGGIETPAFMPVATLGTVKGISPREMRDLGVQVIISNIYHLYLRPGIDVIERAGGIHRFTGWDAPIFVDSGGFQILSLSPLREVTREGACFKSHIDGSKHLLTPELVVDIETRMKADVGMVLDVCPPYNQERRDTERDVSITLHWARRSKKRWERIIEEGGSPPPLMGIVQGGVYTDLRDACIEELVKLDLSGYALGGLSVGESTESTFQMVDICARMLPEERPIYLMGMGTSKDIVRGVSCGVDIFDCVIPTRFARNGVLFTGQGKMILKNSRYREDLSPPDPECTCYTCTNFSRAFLRHLYTSREILSAFLNTIHNIHFYVRFMERVRESIEGGRFMDLEKEVLSSEEGDEEEEG